MRLQDPPLVEPIQVRYQDLDPYGHVNNAVYLEYFESIRMAYWRLLARARGTSPLSDGNVPGARYVIAEATVRYRSPVKYGETLLGAGWIAVVGNRSHTMEFELRCGESFAAGRRVATGSAAHVFHDPDSGATRPRPDWFLSAVAALEGRTEESFRAPAAGGTHDAPAAAGESGSPAEVGGAWSPAETAEAGSDV